MGGGSDANPAHERLTLFAGLGSAEGSQGINWTAGYAPSAAAVRVFDAGTRKNDPGKSPVEFEIALSLEIPAARVGSEEEDLILG